jgi:hypothetical protein
MLARFGLVPQLIVPCRLIQQTHNRLPWRDGAEETQARLAVPHPDHSHREPKARQQFNSDTLVRFDACRAVKAQTMLRVAGDVDETTFAASL